MSSGKYDRTALPVTDSNGVLVGMVTIDDMLDVGRRRGHGGTSRNSAVWRLSKSRTSTARFGS
jgi:magnesium transporter